MSNLSNYQKWKYSSWTLGVYIIITNPWVTYILQKWTGNIWFAFIIQATLFFLAERALMELD